MSAAAVDASQNNLFIDPSMNERVLDDIRQLQLTERNMLEFLSANETTLSGTNKQDIIRRVNGLVQMRYRMYQSIGLLNVYYNDALEKSGQVLNDQKQALQIMEQQLDRMKKDYDSKLQRNNDQIRLIQISDYYAGRYEANTDLVKILIFTLLPIIFLTFLHNQRILPDTAFYVLVALVGAIGAFYFWAKLMDINKRSNMSYDEYDFPRPGEAKVTTTPTTSSSSGSSSSGSSAAATCVGAACCTTDQEFKNNQCVAKPATSSSSSSSSSGTSSSSSAARTESFRPMEASEAGLTRTQTGKYKADINLGSIAFSPSWR